MDGVASYLLGVESGGGGRPAGGLVIPVDNSAEDVPLEILILQSFLRRTFFLYFPIFPKLNGRNPSRKSENPKSEKSKYLGTYRVVMGVDSGGTGGSVPRSRKSSGGRPHKNYDISASFFLAQIICLHFPPFSKQSGRNPRRTYIFGVGRFGCL